ncbi:MAG TPA: purine-nucleoside phosphorylase [Acidimicrobiales bacterium]|jgi:purine-nucleoside phosphorylase|nr:purine-nucleoside phosphorylase [Acidimicrobiales bacterium]
MPTTTAGARGADPFEQARLAARELLRNTGAGRHDVLVVLGTGLSGVAPLLGCGGSPLDLTTLPWFPRYTGIGHRPEIWPIELAGSRILVTAGRLHLYEARTPVEVVHATRTAIAAGCRTVILTCSAGGIDPALPVGSVVAVADHLNLTATSPLAGVPADHPQGRPYVDLTDAWSPRLRALARQVDPSLAEGVYAQMPGPHLETPAEIRMLATLGADLVGMSMVPEAIAARHLGAEVLGLAVVTNPAAGTAPGPIEVDDIPAAARATVEQVATLVRGVIERLAPGAGPEAGPDRG